MVKESLTYDQLHGRIDYAFRKSFGAITCSKDVEDTICSIIYLVATS